MNTISASRDDGMTVQVTSIDDFKNRFSYNSKYSGNGITVTNNKKDLRLNIERLSEIGLLEDGWNGYGSEAINPSIIKKSKEIVNELTTQPIVYPTGRNSIQMQYETDDKSYLEFEIFNNKVLCLEVPQRIYEKARFIKYNIDDQLIKKMNERIKEFHAEKNFSRRNTISSCQTFQTKLA